MSVSLVSWTEFYKQRLNIPGFSSKSSLMLSGDSLVAMGKHEDKRAG